MSEATNRDSSSHDAESVDPILWEDKTEKEMLVLLMSRLNEIESARVKESREIRDEMRKLREEIKAGIEELGNCRKIIEEKSDDKTSTQAREEATTEPEERIGRVGERMVVEEEPEDVVAEDVADQRREETPEVDPLSENYGQVFIKEEVDEEDHGEEAGDRGGFGGLAEIFLKMEDNSSSDELACVPADKSEASGKTGDDSLPHKSKVQYESAYNTFSYWRKKSGRKSSSETVLMAYFEELSKKWKPSTLWSTYSMLKSTINIKEKINIGEYPLLTAFLKKQSAGFHSKKSSVFTSEDIQRYLNEAPDIDFLATKKEMEPENMTEKIEDIEEFSSDVNPVPKLVNQTKNQELSDDQRIKKRKRFSFEEKKNILEETKHHPQDVICKKYGVNHRTLRKWKGQREVIIKEAKNSSTKKLKKKSNTEEMDDAVFKWFVETRDRNIPISGSMIKRQALIVRKKNHPKNDHFKASDGWLHGFKKRKKIYGFKFTEENSSSDDDAA